MVIKSYMFNFHSVATRVLEERKRNLTRNTHEKHQRHSIIPQFYCLHDFSKLEADFSSALNISLVAAFFFFFKANELFFFNTKQYICVFSKTYRIQKSQTVGELQASFKMLYLQMRQPGKSFYHGKRIT